MVAVTVWHCGSDGVVVEEKERVDRENAERESESIRSILTYSFSFLVFYMLVYEVGNINQKLIIHP